MTAWQRIPFVCISFILAAFAAETRAAEKINLDRITPVPATDPIPIQDFFRPLLLQEPKLNPSGTHIAALISAGEDRHNLLVYELQTQKIEEFDALHDNDVYGVNWLNDHRLVFGIGLKKRYGIGLFATETGNLWDCYPLLQYVGSQLISVPLQTRLNPLVSIHGDSLNAGMTDEAVVLNTNIRVGKAYNLLQAGTRYQDVDDVEKLNQKHIKESQLGPKDGLGAGFLADKNGLLNFGFTTENGLFSMYVLDGENWKKCPVDLEQIDVVDCGRTHGELVVLGPREEDRPRALRFMDGATGQLGDILIQDKLYDFDGSLYRDPKTHDILGAFCSKAGPHMVWFDGAYRNLQKVLDGFFPGMIVRIQGSDEAANLFLVATYSDRQPLVYNWVNLEKRTAGLIKNSAPWIDPKRMQPVNVMKFKTRDGRQLDAYLTMPAGATKQNPPPLIVMPCGFPGLFRSYFEQPRFRYSWDFDWEAQYLASRGYAVLRPNHRGSSGYEWMFPKDDAWDFKKMGDDVTDATKALMASGLTDPRRTALMGSGFGAYLALSGALHEPTLYRCTVAIAGMYDWTQFIGELKYFKFDDANYDYLTRKMGDPKKDREKLDALSPVRQVDQIHVPVFVGYDKVSPLYLEQSKELVSQLEKAHVPHEALGVGDDRHGLNHLTNDVELYTAIEAFLAKNLASVQTATVASAEVQKN
jgi:dienelactone hydrolase